MLTGATNLSSNNTLVKRDATGNFAANIITASLSGNATTASNLVGGTAATNNLIYQSGVNTTSFVAAGTSGQILSTNAAGIPTWIAPNTTTLATSLKFDNSGTGVASGTTFNGTTAQTISYNSILPALGTVNQVLAINATGGLSWVPVTTTASVTGVTATGTANAPNVSIGVTNTGTSTVNMGATTGNSSINMVSAGWPNGTININNTTSSGVTNINTANGSGWVFIGSTNGETTINSQTINVPGLAASSAVFTDANSTLTTKSVSGTGNVVLVNSPTLTSPALTGTPTAPTAAAGTNTTQIATTQFVTSAINANLSVGINSQTGTNYILTAGDNGKVVTMSNTNPITLTVPSSLTTGFNCKIIQYGAGLVTVGGSTGVTINSLFPAKSQKVNMLYLILLQ